MQCTRCLLPNVVVLLMIMLGVTALPRVSTAQVMSSVTEKDIAGLIIATQEDRVSVSAGDAVILDQGRLRGVDAGDRYAIFQPGSTSFHPFSGRPIPVPREVIGELAIVRVQDQTSTGIIVYSIREVNVGAPVAPLRLALARQPEARGEDTSVQMQNRQARLSPCLETVRQAIQNAENTGASAAALADARGALASAELALEQANALLAAGEAERATYRLDNALADCLRADQLLQQTGTVTAQYGQPMAPSAAAAPLERYAVQRGDTLWGISARDQIYQNPFMWPLIYKANSQQIRDPDLIFPKQIFVIPRDYAPEEAAAAIQRARNRGAWRVGDGR